MADKILDTRIKHKKDTSANWTSRNPILLNGELIIVVTDAGETRFKIGDGTKRYTQLPFVDEPLYNALSDKVDKIDGKGLSTNDYSTAEKNKLSGIASGAEVNQNAFSNVVVGSTTIAADSKTDTLTFVAGSNVTLTPDATNDKVTIAAKDTVYTHPTYTSKSSGLYKVTVDSTGHVSNTSAVTKEDITALGIPGQDTNTTYSDMTGATSSAAGTHGLVPAPAAGKQTSFLRGDGTWVVPTNTTYSNMTGATTSAAGKSGLVPAPAAGAATRYLRSDGTWQVPPDTNTTYSAATTSTAGLMSASDKTKLDGIATGATKVTIDSALSTSSTNPVQNKSVTTEINSLKSLVGDTTVSTQITNAIANKVDKVSGKGLSTNDYTTNEKNKLSGIASGAEVNQNAFSNVTVGSTTIAADSKTDTLTIVAGSNVTITPDATNDKITIAAKDTVYTHPSYTSKASGLYKVAVDATGHVSSTTEVTKADITALGIPGQDTNTTYENATTSTAGLLSPSDKTKLDGIATGANKTTVDSALSSTSTNPVQNKVVNTAISNLSNLVGTKSVATQISDYAAPKTHEHNYIPTSQKGAANGVAELDSNGKVPSTQLPSYVDDVLEYSAKSNFPSTGETGKIYVDTATNLTYRWSGSAYVEISPSIALGTTSSTAFRGDYGNTAYAHANAKGSAFASGLYKITTNAQGHVTAATAVAKSDITGLGIPAQDTTYSAAGSSLGLVKTGGDVTISGGVITVNDDSHVHSNYSVNSTLTNQNLNDIKTPGFYNAGGGNTVTNKPSGVEHFGLIVVHRASGEYYVQIIFNDTSSYRRFCTNGTWGNWVQDKLTDTTYSAATTSAAGLMSANDKTKLDGIATGANKTVVDSSLSTSSTNPVQNKIVSTEINSIKSLVGDTSVSTQISNAISSKSDTGHTHDDRYYTESEVDTKLSGKSDTSHTHSAYVNQNAFSNVVVGSTTVAADTATDTLTLVAGSNVTLTPDATNDKITIAAKDTVYTHPSYTARTGVPTADATPAFGGTFNVSQPVSDATGHITAINSRTVTIPNATATTSAAGLMSKDDKSKLDGITASADAVSFSRSLTSGTKVGTITINGTGTDLYAPTNTDTHYTTGLKVGASNTATANAAASNGSVYLNVLDNTTVRDSHKIVGSGATTVTSDANGVITVNSTNTTYGVATTSANGLMSSGDKTKLDGVETGANKTVVDSALSTTSTNPVQNKIVTTEINNVKSLVGETSVSTQIENAIADKADASHRHLVAEISDLTATATELNYMDGVTSNVQTQLNGKADISHTHNYATTATYSGTFTSSGWSSSAPYSQTVTVSGIRSTDTPFADVNMSSASTGDAGNNLIEAWSFVGRITVTADNTVVAYCYDEKPTIDIPFVLKVVR